MKRLFLILLCLLLLGGCGAPEVPTEPTEETLSAVTEPAPEGLYEPGHRFETATGGTLKIYPVNRLDTQSLVPMGDDLLLLSTWNTTTLTRLNGEALCPFASVTLDCSIYAEEPSVRIAEQGITYYDSSRQELTFLGPDLKETDRVPMPEGILGPPAVSDDLKNIYYMTDSALWVLETEQGIDRLIREMAYPNQTIHGLHCDGTVLECGFYDGSDWGTRLFVSVSTGQLLYETSDELALWTHGSRYFATHTDGLYQEFLTGTTGSDIQALCCSDGETTAYPLLEYGRIVTATPRDTAVTLDCYDLPSGKRTHSITLPDGLFPWNITAADGDSLWFLSYDSTLGSDILCRWDLTKSTVADDTVYISSRPTPENPDEEGLRLCGELADQISQKHGVRVLAWDDATAMADARAWGYTLVPEHQVSVIRDSLQLLDRALSNFPEGLVKDAASGMGDGSLRIALVRDILSDEDAHAPEDPGGLQFRTEEGNVYICVAMGFTQESVLYHELFHVMESRIFSRSLALDNWNDLNPDGFQYDNGYGDYSFHNDLALIEGETRAFIDYYSMTYPREDRARIFEYAIMPGNESRFSSPIMQQKLLRICSGIREAYGLEDADRAFLWEQYLSDPIAPKK